MNGWRFLRVDGGIEATYFNEQQRRLYRQGIVHISTPLSMLVDWLLANDQWSGGLGRVLQRRAQGRVAPVRERPSGGLSVPEDPRRQAEGKRCVWGRNPEVGCLRRIRALPTVSWTTRGALR